MSLFPTRTIRILFAFAVCAILLTAFSACREMPPSPHEPSEIVAEIGGLPVALGELQMFVNEVRPAVKEHFEKTYGEADPNSKWHTQFGDETPAGYALTLALEKLRPYKVLQSWCKKEGVAEDFSYKTFVEQWKAENADRRGKKQAGEVIYGPESYTERVYYDYLQDKYESDLRKKVKPEPTDAQLQKIYDEHPDLFYRFGQVTMQCVVLPQSDFTRAQADALYMGFESALKGGADAEKAAEQAKVSAYFRTQVFTADDMSTPLVQGYPEVEDAVQTLEPGQSRTIDDNGVQWLFFYCSGREGNGRMSMEECKPELAQMFSQEYFDQTLAQKEQAAQVKLYDNAVTMIS